MWRPHGGERWTPMREGFMAVRDERRRVGVAWQREMDTVALEPHGGQRWTSARGERMAVREANAGR